MDNFTLDPKKAGLLVIDVQEKLFEKVERPIEVMQKMLQAIRGCQILGLPIIVTEQYPKGLGSTVCGIKATLGEEYPSIAKTSFSCMGDEKVMQTVEALSVSQWILVGIEAHVCVLQTAKDLLKKGKQVTVLNDAISSRSIFDYSTAIAEMRDCGARISSTETILFELMADASRPEFKQVIELIK
jgi:nicotinamidase-related amidase